RAAQGCPTSTCDPGHSRKQSPHVLHALPRWWLTVGFASTHTTPGGCTGAWGGCKGVYVFEENGIMNIVQSGKGSCFQDWQEKVSWFLGFLVSARKGSRFKKIAYPLGLATVGATVGRPVQPIIIAKVMGKKAYATYENTCENNCDLKRSVALPTDLASETKTKSEPTSGAWPRAHATAAPARRCVRVQHERLR
uniref:MICOS complex subunit n=1 Tax=Rhinolophus ferrumequinum TaxID=59479 RepID=A0A671FBM8_RHIFE